MALTQNYAKFGTPKGFRDSKIIADRMKLVAIRNSQAHTNFIFISNDMGKFRLCRGCQRVKKFNLFLKHKVAQPVDVEYKHLFGCGERGK